MYCHGTYEFPFPGSGHKTNQEQRHLLLKVRPAYPIRTLNSLYSLFHSLQMAILSPFCHGYASQTTRLLELVSDPHQAKFPSQNKQPGELSLIICAVHCH